MKENIEESGKVKKKKRINFLDLLVIVVVISLIAIYAPRALKLYEERKAFLAESKKEKIIEYPLEVELTEQDTIFFSSFFKDYALGIESGANFLDGISENEMVDFCRMLLSEKYSSSGVISKSAMDSSIKKYFDVEGLDYTSLGYKTLDVYEEYESKKVFNVTKMMQLEKDSDMYAVYVDCVAKDNVQEGTYQKENIEDVYMFTFKKLETEENTETNQDSEVKYLINKVEKYVEETDKTETKNKQSKN